jgi:hypothetical protein
VSGAERGLRSPDARAFNAPLYLLSYLGKLIWRLVRESNPRLPARQAGTLATELTKRCCIGGGDRVRTCSLPLARRLLYRVLSYTPTGKSIRSRVPAPPNRRGRFPPSKRELDEGSLFWHRVRDSNPRPHLERVVSWAI